jgi:hypothetical protein
LIGVTRSEVNREKQERTTTPNIVLSYNREDGAVARLYADAFAREGLSGWWDATLRSGEAYG